jgi:hypothetical protein
VDDSSEVFKLMARCLSGESSQEDRIALQERLTSEPNLQSDFDLLRLTFLDQDKETDKAPSSAFVRTMAKLKEDGLI